MEALKQEIVQRKDYLSPSPICCVANATPKAINTIYFGGGTPSLLGTNEIGDLLHLINTTYPVANEPEITLEANPDTLSSEHARQCLDWAKQIDFENISIDLIYGLPTSNAEQWNRNLDIFFSYNLPHLSAYALTLEPNAILTKQIELGKAQPINEEDALRDYEILCSRAAENGYLHYEISNFCRRGMHSKHNASYWFGTPYAGFGPSAHSYDGTSRQWNVANIEHYCEAYSAASRHCEQSEAIQSTNIDCFVVPPRNDAKRSLFATPEKEILTPEQSYDEYVMLRLRTHWGIDLKWMKKNMGERFSTYCEQHAQPLIAQGRLSQTREFLYLNDAQMLFADGVAEELFWE